MKTKTKQLVIFWIAMVIIVSCIFYIINDYSKRIKIYNAHVCQVYGYQEDCTTKLKGGEIK